MKKKLTTVSFLLLLCGTLVQGVEKVEKAPTDLELALYLLNDGKSDAAMEVVKSRIQMFPKEPDNYMALGLVYLQKNNYTKAKENFSKALSFNIKNATAHYMLAMIYEKEKDYKAAIEKWTSIQKYSKNNKVKELAQKHIKQLEGEIQ